MTRDDAVVGEAAGLSMGLVMLGTHSPMAIEDMTNVRNMLVDIGVLECGECSLTWVYWNVRNSN